MYRVKLLAALLPTVGLSTILCCGIAAAQHGDVEFTYEAGKIAIEFGPEGRVFEGDFGDFTGGPDATDDPGFGSEVDEGLGIDPDDIIGYRVLGPLTYHDGLAFASTSASMTLGSAGGADVTVDSSTFTGSGLVGQADSAGNLHTHVDFAINPSAPSGAYGVLLALSAFDSNLQPKAGVADSDPFYLVLNRGLDEAAFEGAVGAFAATIPEPTALLLASAALAFAGRSRRR